MTPGLGSLLREARVLREFIAFAGDALRKRGEPRPILNSKPVLLIPGLLAGDSTLYPIAARLRAAGCRVFFSDTWVNADCPSRTIERLERILHRAGRISEARVTIVGHSLGGIYARELARRFPLMVERVIMLGSPLRDPVRNSNDLLRAAAGIARFANRRCLASLGDACESCGLSLPGKLPKVPETIVYTKSDGIVNWRSCLESGANVETIEVQSSHCGLSVSADVCDLIVERLAFAPASQPAANDRDSAATAKVLPFRHPRIAAEQVEIGKRPLVSRMEVAADLRCDACGAAFVTNPAGNRALLLSLLPARAVSYFFCGECGDNLTARVSSEDARKRYRWLLAVPSNDRASGEAS